MRAIAPMNGAVALAVSSGDCDGAKDGYFTSGARDTADNVARHTMWYRHALRLFTGETSADERPRAVRELLAQLRDDEDDGMAVD